MVAKRVPLKNLAGELGISRSWLLRRLKNDGVELASEPVMTDRGERVRVTVAVSDANKYRKRYAKARKNAEPATATS